MGSQGFPTRRCLSHDMPMACPNATIIVSMEKTGPVDLRLPNTP